MLLDILSDKALIGILGLVLVLILIALRFPIALAMLVVGVGGNILLSGISPTFGKFYADPYFLFSSHYLVVIPLFLLMGQFAFHSGMSRSLFYFTRSLLGSRQMGVAAIGACGLFGSICGSSLATAATMSKVAIPEMRHNNYSSSYAAGIISAGGTLGTLIPPSIVLIIYALLTEQNLVKMFQAALIPGVIAMVGYMVVCSLIGYLSPTAISKASTRQLKHNQNTESFSRASVIYFFIIMLAVIIGIYGGFFTPSEGASIGCILTALLGVLNKTLSWDKISIAIKDTAMTSSMIYMILLGAAFFSSFLALTELPLSLASWIDEQSLQPYLVLCVILGVYLLLGCLMDTIAMLILTLPIFFPTIQMLDFGLSPQETALWFGVLTLVMVEVGLITPPLGLNIFVIASLHKDITIKDCYIGVIPFLLSDILRIALLITIPAISLTVVRWLG